MAGEAAAGYGPAAMGLGFARAPGCRQQGLARPGSHSEETEELLTLLMQEIWEGELFSEPPPPPGLSCTAFRESERFKMPSRGVGWAG